MKPMGGTEAITEGMESKAGTLSTGSAGRQPVGKRGSKWIHTRGGAGAERAHIYPGSNCGSAIH